MKGIAPRQLIFIAAYTFLCAAAIFLLVRSAGAIVALVTGWDNIIAAALSQLADAQVGVPVWILLCGAVTVFAFRKLVKPRQWNAAISNSLSILILIFTFTAAFLRTRVNGVFIYKAIGIIKMLIESGML